MSKSYYKFLFLILILLLPIYLNAQVAQIVFSTTEQTIEPNATSSAIIIEARDEFGNATKTPETIHFDLTSTSVTGNFLGGTGALPQKYISTGSTKKTFYYKDSTEGTYTLTVNASSTAGTWTTNQSIKVEKPASHLPIVSISGTISSDTTWTPNSIYIIDSNFSLASGTTLKIEPGTIIKAKTTNLGGPSIYGTLIAKGTAELPIYFTSILDDSIGGDSDNGGVSEGSGGQWQGLYFKSGSVGELDYVTVRYSGEGGYGYGDYVGLENDGGSVRIDHSIISDNYKIISNGGGGSMTVGKGIYNKNGLLSVNSSKISNNFMGVLIEAGTAEISNSTLENNIDTTGYGTGFGVYASGGESIDLIKNTFSGNKKTAFINAQTKFTHEGNVSQDFVNRGFEISGHVTVNTDWHTTDLPIIVPTGSYVRISPGATLNILPGSVVKFGQSAYMKVEGNLISRGIGGLRINFTSLKDDSVGGDTNGDSLSYGEIMDWNGIMFSKDSSGVFSFTNLKYTGGFNGVDRAAIFNIGGNILFDNFLFSNNYQYDIYQNTGSTTISHTIFSTSTALALQNVGTSTLDARMNWWGEKSGPRHSTNPEGMGPYISDNILFEPWIKRNPSLPNPVIIVPGIISSYLINSNLVANNEIWPNFAGMILPGQDVYLDGLVLNINGEGGEKIIANSIIKNVGYYDFFDGLVNSIKFESNISVFDYPYDWRLDIDQTSGLLKQKIDELIQQTGAEKIDIISHSMGGLLVKEYIIKFGGNLINKFVDIGTPHMGSPKAFKVLNYGDNFGFEKFGFNLLNPLKTKEISQNMPSVYELLPSKEYFNNGSNYYVLNGINGNNKLNFDQTKSYLKSEGRNSALVDRADEFHQKIDNLNPADYGVETYNFVGCGTPTIGQFFLLQGGDHPIYNIKMINGDGTVPLKSAGAIPAIKTIYVKNAQHALMPSTNGVKELVASILTDKDLNISSYSNLSESSSNCQIPNGKLVSFHSPIELHIYDLFGKHTGPNENGDIENEISGVEYEILDDNKFAFLPDGNNYSIKGVSTGTGTFDVRIQQILEGEVATTTVFADVPLTSTTQVNFDINSSVPDQIYIDQNGDSVFELSQSISTTTAGILESTGKSDKIEIPIEESVDLTVKQVSRRSSRAVSQTLVENSDPSQIHEVFSAPGEVLGVETKSTKVEIVKNSTSSKLINEDYKNDKTIVYTSFRQKIMSIIKRIWILIISKI